MRLCAVFQDKFGTASVLNRPPYIEYYIQLLGVGKNIFIYFFPPPYIIRPSKSVDFQGFQACKENLTFPFSCSYRCLFPFSCAKCPFSCSYFFPSVALNSLQLLLLGIFSLQLRLVSLQLLLFSSLQLLLIPFSCSYLNFEGGTAVLIRNFEGGERWIGRRSL
jgi:hypothetical protein